MNILAFESSCDETAAAVVHNGRRVLSDVVSSQADIHALYGGVVPEIASRRHLEVICAMADKALEKSGLSRRDIDAVAATAAPGLIGALLVGLNFAKSAAFALGIPFIPVHHIRAHVAANYIAFPELSPPFLCLVISGGHSLIAAVRDYTEIEIVGASRDDAAGEAFDKCARLMGLPYPGGAALDALSAGGDDLKYPLPCANVSGAPYDFSFSGLKTAAVNLIHNSAQKNIPLDMPSLAASFSKAVSDELVPRFCGAAREYGFETLCVAGGVAANSRIRRDLTAMAQKLGCGLFIPPVSLCGDNAAMVGAQAYYEFVKGHVGATSQNAFATMEPGISFGAAKTDQVTK